MRHSSIGSPLPPKHLFVGAKCVNSIPLATSLHLDIMIQASLDPAVSRLEYVPATDVAGTSVWLDAVVITRDGKRIAVELPELGSLRDVDSEGLLLMALRNIDAECQQFIANEIRQDPTFTNARAVWHYQGLPVSRADREAILAEVDNGSITLDRLADRVTLDADLLPAVCALVCDGVLSIDLSRGPLTTSVIRNIAADKPFDVPGPGG